MTQLNITIIMITPIYNNQLIQLKINEQINIVKKFQENYLSEEYFIKLNSQDMKKIAWKNGKSF